LLSRTTEFVLSVRKKVGTEAVFSVYRFHPNP
jgi:hypothetical protein